MCIKRIVFQLQSFCLLFPHFLTQSLPNAIWKVLHWEMHVGYVSFYELLCVISHSNKGSFLQIGKQGDTHRVLDINIWPAPKRQFWTLGLCQQFREIYSQGAELKHEVMTFFTPPFSNLSVQVQTRKKMTCPPPTKEGVPLGICVSSPTLCTRYANRGEGCKVQINMIHRVALPNEGGIVLCIAKCENENFFCPPQFWLMKALD